MKVLHIILGIRRESGGPARSVQGLVAAECAVGVDAWLRSLGGGTPWIDGVRMYSESEFGDFDLVHIHGIWGWKLHKVAVACRKVGVPYVVAPRGMLEPWSLKQKWLKKRIARFAYQDRDLKEAAALHATAESEARQFRALGFINKIIISPNGVNLPISTPSPKSFAADKKRALFVSRMHPKKGVRELIEAWRLVANPYWELELVYTVNSDEERRYEKECRELARGLNIVFTGALDDDKKWEAYDRADLFVLPTHSENFGIVVAEALWMGVPVITTKGTPWQELESEKCGWWIDIGVDPLTAALRSALALGDEERQVMGDRGKSLVERKYTWQAVTKPMINGYGEIL